MEERFSEIDNLIEQCNTLKTDIGTIAILNMNDGVNAPEEIDRDDSRWLKLINSIQTYFELYPQDRANFSYKEKLEKLCSWSRLARDKRIDRERLDKIVSCLEMLKNAVKLEQTRKMRSDKESVSMEDNDNTDNRTDNRITTTTNNNKVFIVHGHDGLLRTEVAFLLAKQGIEPIILSDQVDQGKTIIEKIETYANTVSCAICLFTADDEMKDGSKRARQNVVFEAGYFYGKIGRDRTLIIADKGVMSFSDLQGVVYVDKGNWELKVLKELNALGYSISFEKI